MTNPMKDSDELRQQVSKELSHAYYNGLENRGWSQYEEKDAINAILAAAQAHYQPQAVGDDGLEHWMQSLGFEWKPNGTSEGGMWQMPAVAKKQIGFFVSPSTAKFFYATLPERPHPND
jgi:hypothetical protein